MDGEVGPPVVFDFPGALELCRQAQDLAKKLEQYRDQRDEALNTAFELWRGGMAHTMKTAIAPQERANLTAAAESLTTGATEWATSWQKAQQQYNNRENVKAVKYEQDDRSGAEKFFDTLFKQDDSAKQMPEPHPSAAPTPDGYQAPTPFVSYKKTGEEWTMHEFYDVPTGSYSQHHEAGQ